MVYPLLILASYLALESLKTAQEQLMRVTYYDQIASQGKGIYLEIIRCLTT